MSRFALGAVAVALVALPAFPCGGPGADIVDRPLVPVHDYLVHTLYDGEYESQLRPELRFLEPFRRAMADSVAALLAFAYEGRGSLSAADADTLPRHYEREKLGATVRAVEQGDYTPGRSGCAAGGEQCARHAGGARVAVRTGASDGGRSRRPGTEPNAG